MRDRVFVVGAGLAGLSCSVFLARRGCRVELLEAAGHAGGRCRSYYDDTLGCRIDNGNHLLLSGNRTANEYLTEINAADSLMGPHRAEFPFFDLKTGERWTVRPNRGLIPWWIASEGRRVPGTRIAEYLRAVRLVRTARHRTVSNALEGPGNLYRKFWEPFALAVMNTDPREAAAGLLWPVLRETLAKGEHAYRPRIVREGLSESFVDPALRYLEARNLPVRFGTRVRALEFSKDRIAALRLPQEDIALEEGDKLVLAVPPFICRSLVPEIEVPDAFRPIVNVHFRTDTPSTVPILTGIVGGATQWIIARHGIVSVTVSDARHLVDKTPESVAGAIWPEVAQALVLDADPIPPYRVVKEKRATFAQTPVQVERRPGSRTPWKNLFLAGDWTATGLPATLEGAIRSGRTAARAVLEG